MPGCFFSNIFIKRKLDKIHVIIYSSKSSSLFKENLISNLKLSLSKHFFLIFKSEIMSLSLVEITNPDTCSSFIAFYIKEQLEKRVPFRKLMKLAISKVKQSNSTIKGIKVQISGRLNGAEIARTEWVREGQIPLHTLRANIDYSFNKARLIFKII